MLASIKRVLTSKPVFLAGGTATVLMAMLSVWAELNAPSYFRQPVPSPDGKYFAYFDLIQRRFPSAQSNYDLIISTTAGKLLARFQVDPGALSWSNASFLIVRDEKKNQITLIPNNDGRFLVLKTLAIAPGSEPRWSEDGTKLAYIAPPTDGGGIAIYDIQQTQRLNVPGQEESALQEPMLLFWSPGSSELFFLSGQSDKVTLARLNVHNGELQRIAQGNPSWRVSTLNRPRMSPDGKKIYLPPPAHSVIEADSGRAVWVFPTGTKALWSLWSADGRKVFYAPAEGTGQILAHEFSEATDHLLLSRATPGGFFSLDGRSYTFRTPRRARSSDFSSLWNDWINPQWGWQQADLISGTTQMLGRAELSPWLQMQDGAVLMSRDDLVRTQFGFYDPGGHSFRELKFPTDEEDFLRQARTELIVLVSVLLYALLGWFVYLMRPNSPPARALCVLSTILMLLFTGLSAVDAAFPLANAPFPWSIRFMDLTALGWQPLPHRLWLIEGQVLLALIAIAMVPPALLHFALVFPERNAFLARKSALKAGLYVAAFAPLLGVVQLLSGHKVSSAIQPVLVGFYLVAGPVAIITALFAFLHSYRHPPDRRAKDQVRWVSLAFAGPPVGLAALLLLVHLVNGFGRTLNPGWQKVPDSYFFVVGLALFCLCPPLSIGYALIAHKLFDIRLFIQRSVRYSLMTFVVVAVYIVLVGGLSWMIAGSFESPSQPVVIASTLITALIVAPARNRLQGIIDKAFDRARYDVRETLQKFSLSLPTILDRQTLEARIRETVTEAMKCKSFHLFIVDRKSKKLRRQSPRGGAATAGGEVEFDSGEPLCQILLEKGHAFEVEVSPYDTKLIPVIQSASARLSKLEAALILGLVRRGELVGMMVLGPKTSEEFYNSEDIQLLQGVAHQAATAVENTELFEEVARDRELRRELEVASEVQAHLFPVAVPSTSTCQIAGQCLPASSVSGDYYDFLELPGGKIGVAIGDVSGKGMAAALLMANLQGLLRSQAPTSASPAELLRRINRQLFGSSRGAKYCTFFYGVYNEHDQRLVYTNAGHNPPLLLDGAGPRFLDSTGLPLGLFPDVSHDVHTEILEAGARIVMYSDGITEARNLDGEDYGVDRLAECVRNAADLNATALMERILADVRSFSCGAPIEDDQTIVLLHVNEGFRPTSQSPHAWNQP